MLCKLWMSLLPLFSFHHGKLPNLSEISLDDGNSPVKLQIGNILMMFALWRIYGCLDLVIISWPSKQFMFVHFTCSDLMKLPSESNFKTNGWTVINGKYFAKEAATVLAKGLFLYFTGCTTQINKLHSMKGFLYKLALILNFSVIFRLNNIQNYLQINSYKFKRKRTHKVHKLSRIYCL